jgi:hypothetical protein
MVAKMNGDASAMAQLAYNRARNKAIWRDFWARLQGRPNGLLAFDDIREKLRVGGPMYKGLQTIPIKQIVGSVDRYMDFDRAFLPSQTYTNHRWRRIGTAYYEDIILPPVTLYKVGDAYFVVDGNHRVSVAHELGREFVDAEVYECPVRIPVAPDIKPESLEQLSERVQFLMQTGLDRLGDKVDIALSIDGAYPLLIEHIATHRYFQSVEWSRDFTFQEAAVQWFEQVYLPTVQVIRETGILDEFPGRTETDLYLWVVEHLYYLREQFGASITTEDAARNFASQFTPRPLKRLWHHLTQHVSPQDEVHPDNT